MNTTNNEKIMTIPPPPSNNIAINTWQQFTAIVRSKGCNLLKCLGEFPEAVLVAGCQRSGTTMFARIITQSEGMTNYWFGPDDELDAALILSGYVTPPSSGRYCFQTTYVDECYCEYYEHTGSYKIIWLIRNPYSVVYSLLYNWAPASLDGTFEKCATQQLTDFDARLYRLIGLRSISRTRRACELYKAKTLQLFELYEAFGSEKIIIIDYDKIVLQKDSLLPKIYQYINLEYNTEYGQQIHSQSIDKKSKLSRKEKKIINNIAEPIYKKARSLIDRQ